MKNLLVIASLVSVSTIASAQPATESDVVAESTPAATATYLEGGAMLGADQGFVAAVTLEAGRRIGHGPLWLHAMGAAGGAGGVDERSYGGTYLAARAGLEVRPCIDSALCAMAGLDVGVRHVEFMAEYDHANVTGALVVPRVGLDLGTRHLRVRPGLELAFGDKSTPLTPFAFALTTGIAYVW